jgi:hypothetical protein
MFPPRTTDVLKVDNTVVDSVTGGMLHDGSTLVAEVDFNGNKKRVEARLAKKTWGVRLGCHIVVDNQLVGGDVTESLSWKDPQVLLKQYEKGAAWYI